MKPLYFINFFFAMNLDEIYYSFELTNSSLYSRKMTSSESSVTPPLLPCPWLVYSQGRKRQNFYSIPQRTYYIGKIQFMSGKRICASFFGWMVMLDRKSKSCFLLNPTSMEKINLPPWKLPVVQTCVITSSPTDPNCIVAFLDNEEPYITFCRPGEDRWVEQDYGTSLYENDTLHAVTVCKGSIYGLASRELVRLEVRDGIFVMNKLVADIPPRIYLTEVIREYNYLVESCGEVFCVSMLFEVFDIAAWKVEDIQVYRMDFSKGEWVRVDSLGEDRAFFVNGFGNTASCSASESGVEGNSIYFIDRDYRSLGVFNVEESSVHVSLPTCPNVVHNLPTFWVMPKA
ncbi:hypothetical protein RJ639_006646 [Escallonia herrerae]|uniref:KIB1-4 beta-propeller domain-containing protein n=1 Tax=Escallonia herrerae TaxID=1293975 RepID=A0AA88V0E3_9ASTE|nr:hypothetical protein RJ639_024398 [Escallonia herrerae]KAK2999422.1 hypothetical protein RJ639_024399 [Escallonia herrerae]KAK3005700.1 hypothetical protein RJ639_017626 [Escallonia herrerae]KAK3017579.1 hypothetical protein RJ639_006646 [Escallonia herrerae]